MFRAGVEESVSVTIFGARAETRVQAQLSVKGQTVAHGHGPVLGENAFSLILPNPREAGVGVDTSGFHQ